ERRLDELDAEFLRTIHSGELDEGELLLVLADILPELFRIADDVENVVGDLKSQAEVLGKHFDAAKGGGADVAEHAANRRGGDEQRARFSRVDELERVEIELRFFAVKIDRLAGDRPIPTDGIGDAANHLLHRPLSR